MKKFLITVLSIFILVPIVFVGAAFVAFSVHYKSTFPFGVFINGVYATDKTPEVVNDTLMEYVETGDFTIHTKDGSEIVFALDDFGYTYSYLDKLQTLQKSENLFSWMKRMLESGGDFAEYQLEAVGTYDEAALQKYLADFDQLKDHSDLSSLKVEINKTDKGYELTDDTVALLDAKKAESVIMQAISEGKSEVNLEKEDCYIQAEYTTEMKETLKFWEKINQFQKSRITYVFQDETEVVDASVIADWFVLDEKRQILLNEEGMPQLDQDKIKIFVAQLAEKYDTVSKARSFHTTSGRDVIIKNSNYGDKMDQKAEVAYLMEAVKQGTEEEHVPAYLQRAYADGENDIGSTYIEVDMSNQTMYYYQGGKIAVETPVVTGNTSLGRGTPEKVCYVYFKQRNRVLHGEDYDTPVSYWIAVNGAIGIHDANWRGKFGGTIYKSNGSHGCINTPTSAVSELYELVEVGTPVIIFY